MQSKAANKSSINNGVMAAAIIISGELIANAITQTELCNIAYGLRCGGKCVMNAYCLPAKPQTARPGPPRRTARPAPGARRRARSPGPGRMAGAQPGPGPAPARCPARNARCVTPAAPGRCPVPGGQAPGRPVPAPGPLMLTGPGPVPGGRCRPDVEAQVRRGGKAAKCQRKPAQTMRPE